VSVQFIKSARPGKPVTWYIYAWRGGPLIRKVESPRKPSLGRSDHTAIAAAMVADRAIPPDTMRATLREWCPVDPRKPGSPEWAGLADNTKRVWNPHVDLIEARWGKHPMALWDDPRMVAKVVKWRDERAATPRTADMGVQVLREFLEFARLRGRVRINVARDIPSLYHGADRADIIWTDADMAAFAATAAKLKRPQVDDGLRLAAMTGLRRADLVSLTWSQIGEFAIIKRALKVSRRKRRRAIIPQTPQLEALLAELRTRFRKSGVETVLVNSHGTAWTPASFGGSVCRIRDEAGIEHIDDDGKRHAKHLHDVRGTFCTMLLTEWELTDREAAEVMAWSPERVARIRSTYVDHARVVVALGERIAAKQFAKQIASDAKD
jgi:integrase